MLTNDLALKIRTRQDSKRYVQSLLRRRTPQEIFRRFDANGDGKISREEFRKAMRQQFGVTTVVADQIFDQWDTDGSRTIEYGELERGINRPMRRNANEVAHLTEVLVKKRGSSARQVRRRLLRKVVSGKDASEREKRTARILLKQRRSDARRRL